jgi:hypothetical protein
MEGSSFASGGWGAHLLSALSLLLAPIFYALILVFYSVRRGRPAVHLQFFGIQNMLDEHDDFSSFISDFCLVLKRARTAVSFELEKTCYP